MSTLQVSHIRFTAAPPHEVENGLLGWVSMLLNGHFHVYSVAVRRTLDGRLALSFPSRKDEHGRLHPLIRPIDNKTRQHLEQRVFEVLGQLAEVDR